MACKKYTLTNTGSTIQYFSYRKCDDNQTQSQVSLKPGRRKNIWLVDGSYSSVSTDSPSVTSQVFPVTPSNTRTPTQTPTQTPTPTQTKTQTPTPTQTKTQTPTPSQTRTQTPTQTTTQTQTPTQTTTQTQTPTMTQTPSGT
jgi:hypothetical protein